MGLAGIEHTTRGSAVSMTSLQLLWCLNYVSKLKCSFVLLFIEPLGDAGV